MFKNLTIFDRDKREFLMYSFYVWGITLLISLATFIADHSSIFKEWMKPNIGIKSCWISGI